VASNGTDFLVVWQQGEPGEQGIYASRVFSDGTPGPAVRLDELGPGDDARPAVAWAGYGRYLVVWQSAATNGIQMAAVNPAGQVVEGSRQPLALSATEAQVAANPVTGQALVVYAQACDLGTCIKGRLVGPVEGGGLADSVGPEMTIGQPDPGQMLLAPAVAYEPAYGGWLVAWEAAYYWQASYWNNTTLSGPPIVERREAHLDHDWGEASPDSLINPDQFSARWRREIVVEAGIYHFAVTGDDGIRLLVDEQPVIDDWSVHHAREKPGSRYLSGGSHTVTVEYFENAGSAVAKLRWDPADKSAPVLRFIR